MKLIDRYSYLARFLPAAVVLLPAGLAMAAWFPIRFDGWPILIGLVTTGGAAMLMAQVARDAGKNKEAALWESWGGQPTVMMLRHRDGRIDRLTLARYHKKLAELAPDCPAPTAEQEQADPAAADAIYASWTRYLREATRDREKFSILFSENVSYGFRRNLWSMKPAGVMVAVIGIIAAMARIGMAIWTKQTIPPVSGVAAIVNIILLVLWILRFNPSWIRLTADAYAERLLASCDQISRPAKARADRSPL